MKTDRISTRMRYLRVSLLKACNFNCFYCLPPRYENVRRADITDPQRFKRALAELIPLGVEKVRFTGGEPTLYRELPELISYTKELNSSVTTALTTNARLLKQQAPQLAKAGLDSVNISLDTINPAKFEEITGVDSLARVIEGIKTACDYFSRVRLNTVAIKGVNDTEFAELIDFADNLGVDTRFIEYMPTRYGERRDDGYISAERMREIIPYELIPQKRTDSSPALYYNAKELSSRVGFITSVSQPFCHSCDRLRLTSDGKLYSCLFSKRSMNLFSMFDCDSENIPQQVRDFVAGKTLTRESKSAEEDYAPSFSEIGG